MPKPTYGGPATPMSQRSSPGPSSSYEATPYGTVREYSPGVTGTQIGVGADGRPTLTQGMGGGSIVEHDPDLTRRTRDRMDAQSRPGMGGGAGGNGGGGGGTAGSTAPPLSADDIFSVLDRLKGETPAREPTPAAPPRIEAPTPSADAPSRSLAFARSKDRAGRIGAQALKALKDQMSERGISGSGIEGQLTADILGQTATGLADAEFTQQRASEDQAWDAAKMGYQGAIGQRANDMGLIGAGFSGGIQQRGQDIGANNLLGLAPTILSLLARGRY